MSPRWCVLVCALGACADVCSLEEQIDTFIAERDALDCGFAHRFVGDPDYFGAESVRSCILASLDDHHAFVGGYVGAGIDSMSTYAYLGTARGELELLVERIDTANQRSLSRAPCSLLVTSGDSDVLGLQCIGLELEPLCGE